MAYIIVTTDDGKVILKKHHSEYLDADSQGAARLLNHLASAVLASEGFAETSVEIEQAIVTLEDLVVD